MADTENTETNPAVDNTVVTDNNTSPLDFDDPAVTSPPADEQVPASEAGEGTVAEADGGSEFTSELLARAGKLGITEDEAKELGTPASLARVCDAIESRAKSDDGGTVETHHKPRTPAKPERLQLKLDPDVIGAETAEIVKQIDEHYAAQVEALNAELAAMREQQTASVEASRKERINGYFDSLGKDFDHIVGAEHPRNRSKVLDKMDVLRAGYEATGRKAPQEKELFQEAFQSEFGDRQAAVARKKINEQLKKRQSQITARPDQRTAQMTPEQRAVAAVAQAMREKEQSQFAS